MNVREKMKLTERITFELGAEMFNIFSHANFSPTAVANISSSGCVALTTKFNAREIQFHGRISF
jgi:hypothetical protein